MGTLFEGTAGGAFALAMIGDGDLEFIVAADAAVTAVAAAGTASVVYGYEGVCDAVEVTIAIVRARR